MVSLFKGNGLNCKDEMHLMAFFEKYFKHRENLPDPDEEARVKKVKEELIKYGVDQDTIDKMKAEEEKKREEEKKTKEEEEKKHEDEALKDLDD